jgi:hypothetical protein
MNHHEKIGPTGHEHLNNLGESEQLGTDLMDLLAVTRDVDLMGLHIGFSGRALCLRRRIVA